MTTPKNPSHIDFMGRHKPLFGLSIILIIISIGLFSTRGLNYGIDFLGGTEVQLKFDQATSIANLRESIEAAGFRDPVVQLFGDAAENEFLIRVGASSSQPEGFDAQIREAFKAKLEEPKSLVSVRYAGDKAYFKFSETISPETVQQTIADLGVEHLKIERVSQFGKETEHEVLVLFGGVSSQITEAVTKAMPENAFQLRRVDSVGPKVGKELRQKGVISVMLALVFILLYIWMRFDMTFAPGAIVALLHDVLLTIGVFSLLQIEVNLPIIAALLTIVGYSLNDTIVVYDRIRENAIANKTQKLDRLINTSLNQTLSRTLLTSTTTLLVTIALFIFGGAIIHNFATALTLGVVFGTYSSIFIASPLVIYLSRYMEQKKVKAA